MATFTAATALDLKFHGYEFVGAAGVVHRISDALADEFESGPGQNIPGFVWVNEDEEITIAADGDGTTDASPVFALAMAASRTIIVPKGTYRLTEALLVSSGVTLAGMGEGSVLAFDDNAAAANLSVYLNAVSNVTIRDLRITTPDATSRTGVYGLIRGSNATNVRVLNCDFDNSPSVGIHTIQCTDWLIGGNRVSGCWADGIHISRQSKRIRIIGNDVSACGDDAIGVISYSESGTYAACEDVVVDGNTLTGSTPEGSGVVIQGGKGIAVKGNAISGMAGAGIYLGGATGTYVAGRGFTVVGNSIRDTVLSGIHTSGLQYAVIADNIVTESDGSGIAVLGSSLDLSVVGNTCHGNAGYGIYEESGSGPNVFVANNLRGNTSGEKLINGGTSSVVASNSS